jgi:hypothetical protein
MRITWLIEIWIAAAEAVPVVSTLASSTVTAVFLIVTAFDVVVPWIVIE